MATNGLGSLIMTAVIDQGFRKRLLAAPAEAMSGFDLTKEEQRALKSVHAQSFSEFADQLYRWLEERDPLPLRVHRNTDTEEEPQEESVWGFPVEVPSTKDRSAWREKKPVAALRVVMPK